MWIEIIFNVRREWLETGSSPTRGMWIEIVWVRRWSSAGSVIPHTGDVD